MTEIHYFILISAIEIVLLLMVIVQRFAINKQQIIIEHYKKHPLLHSEEANIIMMFCLNNIKDQLVINGDYEKAAKCRDLIKGLEEINAKNNDRKHNKTT